MSSLVNESEDDLLLKLDILLYGTEEHISGRELRAALERSRRWVSVWVTRNREKLCEEVRRHGLDRDELHDYLIDIGTVTDIVAQFGFDQPVATVLAAILIKRGLKKLCP
jgi:hypothetical protein